MNPFDRVLVMVYSITTTLLLIVLTTILAGWDYPLLLLSGAQRGPFFREALYSLLGLYILAGIRLAWWGMRPAARQAVVHEGTLGQIRIALSAIEALVEKVVSQNSGVREVKARVVAVPQGIGINVRATVTPDIHIPELSEIMQRQVKDRVLEVTGISVHNVRILVENITSHKPRVE